MFLEPPVPTKRLIGVVPVRDGRVAKSVGYERWFPAGTITTALKNLERWGVDEIVLLDVSRRPTIDERVLIELQSNPIRTPLTFGGGIRTLKDVSRLLRSGVDRILIESLFWESPRDLDLIIRSIGAQAIVGSLPIVTNSAAVDCELSVWTGATDSGRPSALPEWIERMSEFEFEEVLVTDVTNEGRYGGFSPSLPDRLARSLGPFDMPVIWFGGICEQIAAELLARHDTVGVAIGNVLLEHEIVVPRFRRSLLRASSDLVRSVRPAHD